MTSENVNLEERLTSLLSQLQTDAGILYRIVYKAKNQHRRSLYFQYLMKVRRDVRLLESARLDDVLKSVFQVISGKPTQRLHFLESLKRRKNSKEKYDLMERLLGVARLLSQMVEPMVKTAIEISSLLARSFFMGFSVTILALLARLRVLVQQILLDVVSVFNTVTALSQSEQSVKLNCGVVEAIREYYPSNEDVQVLECVWETDKFVLHEKVEKGAIVNQDEHLKVGIEASPRVANVTYETIEAFLGVDEQADKCIGMENPFEELRDQSNVKKRKTDASADQLVKAEVTNEAEGIINSMEKIESNDTDTTIGVYEKPPSPLSIEIQSDSRKKVAFISVKKPTLVKDNDIRRQKKSTGANNDKDDPFFSLLTGGNGKGSLF